MRKSGLPVLKVRFPDGTEQYWNTFTKITQPTYSSRFTKYCRFVKRAGFSCNYIINAIAENQDFAVIDFKSYMLLKQKFFK
jgi:sucrose phosphorylase